MESMMEKTKSYTKNEFTCVVSVFLDKEYRYDKLEQIPPQLSDAMSHHEFDDYVLADEYCRLLLEMNKEFIGRFLYKVNYCPIEESTNFTNKLKYYQLNNLNNHHHFHFHLQ
jgi:hypothetical protein